MPEAIPAQALSSSRDRRVMVDVRKSPARARSGETVAGALYRSPFSADSWWPDFKEQKVVVFCVHGHEVSQAVCGFLADQGIDVCYLDGGFNAWKAAGLPVSPLVEA